MGWLAAKLARRIHFDGLRLVSSSGVVRNSEGSSSRSIGWISA